MLVWARTCDMLSLLQVLGFDCLKFIEVEFILEFWHLMFKKHMLYVFLFILIYRL